MPITKQQQRRGFLADLPILDDGEIGLAQDTSQVFIGNLGVNLELAGGEANTASNIGAGVGLFDAKVGSDLQFKTLVAGTNIIIQDGVPANSITISAAGGFVDPLTTRGDILIRNALNVTTRLAIGTNGQVLTSNGTDVSWAAAAGGGAFATAANITSNSPGTLATDDFVFGSNSLDGIETRFFFDKSNGAFRAGPVATAVWDDINRGAGSTAFGSETTASGPRSMAWGIQTQATNQNATAFGVNTFALGPSSTAWGWNNTTAGALFALGSTAFGQGTQATNRNSTSWGLVSQATGQEATSWGTQTTASGQNATAWGAQTTASGIGSTAWGYAPPLATTLASGDYSTAFGTQTTASFDNATAWGQNTNSIGHNTTAWGSFAQAGVLDFTPFTCDIVGVILTSVGSTFQVGPNPNPDITNGDVVVVNGVKALVVSVDGPETLTLDRAVGDQVGSAWEFIRGQFATAWGNDNVASGAYATAWGYESTASGISATAFGFCTVASGENSMSFGNESIASGDNSVAFGTNTEASGVYSGAWGVQSQARGVASVVFGDHVIADPSINGAAFEGGIGLGSNILLTDDFTVGMGSHFSVQGDSCIVIGLGQTPDAPAPLGPNGVDRIYEVNEPNMLVIKGGYGVLLDVPLLTNNLIDSGYNYIIQDGHTYTHFYMNLAAARTVQIDLGATLVTRVPIINGTLVVNGLLDVI